MGKGARKLWPYASLKARASEEFYFSLPCPAICLPGFICGPRGWLGLSKDIAR